MDYKTSTPKSCISASHLGCKYPLLNQPLPSGSTDGPRPHFLADFLATSKAQYLSDVNAERWTVVMGNEAGGAAFIAFHLIPDQYP